MSGSPDELVCWRCGTGIADEPLPLGRLSECRACGAELHVCRMCAFFDPGRAQGCLEPVADPVGDKQRANFCGYFQARPNAYVAGNPAGDAEARARLADLFGDPSETGSDTGPVADDGAEKDSVRDQLDALFRKE